MIYFDHNATSPLSSEARQAWIQASEQFIGNPSSPHRIGSRADAALTRAREIVAGVLGCDAADLVWTSGATESANMVIHHFWRELTAEAEVWVSALEHPCVLEATRFYFPKRHRLIPATPLGTVDLEWLDRELAARPPGLVAVLAANNETGVLQSWREVLAACRQYRVPCFCDAVQWVGKMPAGGLGQCDFVSASGHKFGGPKGVGFLKCPNGPFHSLLVGGQQEEGRRAGTENVPAVVAMAAALEAREKALGARAHSSRLEWRQRFEQALLKTLPGSEIVGIGRDRLWNTVSALMPDADCRRRWVVKLDKLGFAVSTGSACASGREEPSHVLTAMGYSAGEAGRVLRFSSGWETTDMDWDALAKALVRCLDD